MRAVIQRVNKASVLIEGETERSTGRGLVVFIGVGKEDGAGDLDWMTEKILNLRIFEDQEGKMNLSVTDIGGEILLISQFTLFGNCRKGRRPSYSDAAPPEEASRLYEELVSRIQKSGVPVKTGIFQAYMKVVLENDGPVTLLLDSKKTF